MRRGSASQKTSPSSGPKRSGGTSVNVASPVGEPRTAEPSTRTSSSRASASNFRSRPPSSGSR